MSTGSFAVLPAMAGYAASMSEVEPDLFKRLRDETASMPESMMQIDPSQGLLMGMLAKLIGAKAYLEIGVFTGYSSLAVGTALPDDGRIVACDVSEEFTAIARRYWAEAGILDKIELRLAPALETLSDLAARAQRFDMAFIDADKENMAAYFEACVGLVRSDGLILLDNVLWSGNVMDEVDQTASTVAIRNVNEVVKNDSRVEKLMLPLFDGLTLVRKR